MAAQSVRVGVSNVVGEETSPLQGDLAGTKSVVHGLQKGGISEGRVTLYLVTVWQPNRYVNTNPWWF